LAAATVLVAVMSELLVGSVESAREQLGLTEVFVGVIVVAIVGNAAEHSTAITVALKNQMDLSLGIAIGSSLQIVVPGNCRDGAVGLDRGRNQRRWGMQLARRRAAFLGLSHRRDPLLLPA
jgi:hypothetical protein